MGKIKDKQASPNSWKPAIQHDAFISKNKKRKEKRLAQKLTTKQAETGDFIPVKKAALTPVNKIKNEARNGLGPLTKGKKENTLLSTSLPIKGSKKEKRENANNSISALAPVTKKVTGILSNPNTPKRHNKKDRVTFQDQKIVQKFIDKEAEEGEEAISSKPYEKKGNKNKKPPIVDSSDENDNSSVEAEDYLDMEASEGEETDDGSDDEEAGTDTDDSDDYSDENTYLSSFINDDSEESNDEAESKMKKSKSNNQKLKKAPQTPAKRANPALQKAEEKTDKSVKPETPVKTPKKKEKIVKSETPAKTNAAKVDQKSGKKKKLEVENTDTKKTEEAEAKTSKKEKLVKEIERPSEFIGFIRKLPKTIKEEDIKSALSKSVDVANILLVTLVKDRKSNLQKAFVYLKDSESLAGILNTEFKTATTSFTVYRAKSSAKEEWSSEPVAFLPRVPMWITSEQLKEVAENDLGAGKLTKIKEKRFNLKTQTRNILATFADADTLKKAIFKGEFKVKDHIVIVREALEGVPIQVYRAVFANIPENTSEIVLKKALEGSIGKNTVESIRFSFRKKSFAFVVFKTEEAQKKALALGESFSLKGTKLKVLPYTPFKIKKRAPSNKSANAKVEENKKRKLETAEETQKPSPKKRSLTALNLKQKPAVKRKPSASKVKPSVAVC